MTEQHSSGDSVQVVLPALPRKGQTITLLWQGQGDGTVEGFEVNRMLVVPSDDGVVYVRREDAKEFFGLVEPSPAPQWQEGSAVNFLRFHCQELIGEYGSVRKAADALGVEHSYLYRLASGEKDWPSDDTVRRLGLERVVTYRKLGPPGSPPSTRQPTNEKASLLPSLLPAMRRALDALEAARAGLNWYQDMVPEQVNTSDYEADEQIGASITELQQLLNRRTQ